MSNRQSLYTKECGSYYYKDYNGGIIFMSDEISVLYDLDGVMLKHGSPENVQKHFEKYKKMQALQPGLFSFRVVTSNKWKVEELNKILTHSGYVVLLETDPERFEEDVCLE